MYTDSNTNAKVPYPPAHWRTIIHREANGAYNMAVDDAIAEAVAAGDVPPTLRFYQWNPACLSLGRFQSIRDADTRILQDNKWDVVRRLTGGRAILHVDELTYSVCIPESDARVSGGIVESYRRLSQGLMTGLALLGADVHAEKAGDEAKRFKGPVCFEVPSDYEITANGKKLIGSAQTRRDDIVLQHGAFPLYGDVSRICDALVFESETAREAARQRVLQRATTLEEVMGIRFDEMEVIDSLIEGFSTALNVHLEVGSLTPEEAKRAAHLEKTKYTNPEWTARS